MLRAFVLCSAIMVILPQSTRAESPSRRWQQSESSIALLHGQDVLWQFNYGPDLNVPCFHPVRVSDGPVLTWDRPADHAWHHGLWFSWKYINRVNYWEHDRRTGKPAGRTEWFDVEANTRDDQSATISMLLAYHPSKEKLSGTSSVGQVGFCA